MLISKELNGAINEQIGHEFMAAHTYNNIAAYFENLALKKLAGMFYKQANEEHEHALKFIRYIPQTGGILAIPAVPAPKSDFTCVEEAIKLSVDWELEVTRRINNLMSLAIQEKDYLAQDFLRWFVTEQLEEVSSMENLLKIVQMAGEKNIFMLEAYLSHED